MGSVVAAKTFLARSHLKFLYSLSIRIRQAEVMRSTPDGGDDRDFNSVNMFLDKQSTASFAASMAGLA